MRASVRIASGSDRASLAAFRVGDGALAVAVGTGRAAGGVQRAKEVGQPHLQVGQQREVGTGAGDLLEVEGGRDQRLLEDRAFREDIAAWTREDRSAGKRLAALETHQLRERHEDAVLASDVLHDPLPAGKAGRPSGGVVGGDDAAGGARARNDDQLGSTERREHRRERVPGILTDQDRGSAPPGVESLDAPAGLDESLLVEHAVGGQEHLAVDVPDARVGAAKSGVETRVVETVAVDFVEAEGDVERRGLRVLVLAGEVGEEALGRDGQIADAALEEVSGERGLRRHQEIRRLRPSRHLPEERAEPAEILVVSALAGAHLGNGKAEHPRNVYLKTCSGISRLAAPSGA